MLICSFIIIPILAVTLDAREKETPKLAEAFNPRPIPFDSFVPVVSVVPLLYE